MYIYEYINEDDISRCVCTYVHALKRTCAPISPWMVATDPPGSVARLRSFDPVRPKAVDCNALRPAGDDFYLSDEKIVWTPVVSTAQS